MAEPPRAIEHAAQPRLTVGSRLVGGHELELRLDAGQRRAALVRRVVEELPLLAGVLADRREQAIQRRDEAADFFGRPRKVERCQVARRAALDLFLDIAQWVERPTDTEPDERGNDSDDV